jgi:hypothetical protein
VAVIMAVVWMQLFISMAVTAMSGSIFQPASTLLPIRLKRSQ